MLYEPEQELAGSVAEKPRVLCLDDDELILVLLEYSLQSFCEVITARDGYEALVLLREKGPFAVVLVDLVMPGMNGITFLTEARKVAPDTVRMLLTGNTNVTAAVAAVNQGSVFRFLTKPCDPPSLRVAVQAAIQHYKRFQAEREQTAEALLVQKHALEIKHRHLSCLYALSRKLEALGETDTMLSADMLDPLARAVERSAGPVYARIRLDSQTVPAGFDAFVADECFPLVSANQQRGAVEIGRIAGGLPVQLTQDERNVLLAMTDRLCVHFASQDARRMARERQQQLIEADKLASLGVMVAGIAHEINNPVNNIMLNASLLRDAMPEILEILDVHYKAREDASLGGLPYHEMRVCFPQMLQDVVESCDRIRAITSDLRDASPVRYEKQHERVQVNHVVARALRMCSHMDKHFAERVDVQLSPDAPIAACSQRRLEQVVINLLQNAWQVLDKPAARIHVSTHFEQASGEVHIRVKDEGCGMSPYVLAHVKDPFFTTRRDKGGTGLGIFVSNSMIEEMGGQLAFESEEGVGTLASIRLPAEKEI
jgi:C4-dicarboxylate-specific signal transduction histidine kinase